MQVLRDRGNTGEVGDIKRAEFEMKQASKQDQHLLWELSSTFYTKKWHQWNQSTPGRHQQGRRSQRSGFWIIFTRLRHRKMSKNTLNITWRKLLKNRILRIKVQKPSPLSMFFLWEYRAWYLIVVLSEGVEVTQEDGTPTSHFTLLSQLRKLMEIPSRL